MSEPQKMQAATGDADPRRARERMKADLARFLMEALPDGAASVHFEGVVEEYVEEHRFYEVSRVFWVEKHQPREEAPSE
jgi:hypothetical protein